MIDAITVDYSDHRVVVDSRAHPDGNLLFQWIPSDSDAPDGWHGLARVDCLGSWDARDVCPVRFVLDGAAPVETTITRELWSLCDERYRGDDPVEVTA